MSKCDDCARAAQNLSDENWILKQALVRCMEEMNLAGANYAWLQQFLETKYPEVFPRGHVKMSDL